MSASATIGATRRSISLFAASPLALIGVALFVLTVGIALIGPLITSQDPYDLASINLLDSRLPPGAEGIDGNLYWLGTDGQGRDMTSAIIYGLRTSIMIGLIASAIALVLGTTLGLIAGYARGWVDALIMRIVDLQLSVPSILIAIVLLAVLGRGVGNIILALVTVQWVYFARTVRSSCLIEREKEYVEAVRHYEKALEIFLKVSGPKHPNVARSKRDLGYALIKNGEKKKGLDMLLEAKEIFIATEGAQYVETQELIKSIKDLR